MRTGGRNGKAHRQEIAQAIANDRYLHELRQIARRCAGDPEIYSVEELDLIIEAQTLNSILHKAEGRHMQIAWGHFSAWDLDQTF